MVQNATKQETIRIAAGTGIGILLMYIVFGVLHAAIPGSVPFDWKVILAGLAGGAVATGNFFLMSLTVQKVAAEKDDRKAYQTMQGSYRFRLLLQVVWIILAIVLPCFNTAAGIIPLFIPSLVIKIYYIFIQKKDDPLGIRPEKAAEAPAGPDDETETEAFAEPGTGETAEAPAGPEAGKGTEVPGTPDTLEQ